MAEFITTHRGGKALHYQGYIYTKIRDGKEGITFWRCQDHKSGCLARASSEGSSVIVTREHDQPPNNAMCTKERRRLTTLFDRFNNGEFSLDDFLEAVKH